MNKIIEDHIQDAAQRGARILCGGKREPGSHHFPTTVITECDHTMKVASEETFGPVVAVMRFKTEDEALRLANDSPSGWAPAYGQKT